MEIKISSKYAMIFAFIVTFVVLALYMACMFTLHGFVNFCSDVKQVLTPSDVIIENGIIAQKLF